MEDGNIALWLSVVATVLSILSFGGAVWRLWRDRARLRFTISKVIRNNETDGRTFNLVEVKVTNIWFRPIILTGFFALGRTGVYHMGDNDPTAMAYGHCVEAFPKQLSAGETLKIYPISIEALERNQTDPQDPKHHFNPYEFFVFSDSFGKFYPMKVYDVLRELNLLKQWKPTKGLAKVPAWWSKVSCFHTARKHGFLPNRR